MRRVLWALGGAACIAAAVLLAARPWERARSAPPPRSALPQTPAPRPETAAPDAPGPPLPSSPRDAAPPLTPERFLALEGPIRGRLLALQRVPEKDRLLTAWKLGEELGKSRDCLDEVLALLHEEEDPAVLFWLGEIIRGGRGALATLTDAEWGRLAPVLLYGQPAERRRAVAGIHSGYMRAPPPEILDALRQCVRTERDPGVLALAARGLLVLVAGWEGMADDLVAAMGRMPAGAPRREVAYVVQRYVDAPVLEARFRAARDAAERNDWAWALALAWGQAGDDGAPDALRFMSVYREVTDRDVRESLLASCPRDEAVLRELRAWEADPDLRRKLDDLLPR